MSENSPSLPNSPEARTAEGALKPTGPLAETITATTTESDPATTKPEAKPDDKGPILGGADEPKLGPDGKPIEAKKEDAPKAGAPEKYEEFKVPDGFTLDETVAKEAGDLFKGMNLNQSQAQSLVDFYAAKAADAAKAPYDAWAKTQDDWKAAIKADPEIGGKLDQVKASVGKLYDALGDPKLVSEFKEAMEFTGAGNNPAFVKALYKLSQKLTEGGPVLGRGPVEVRSPSGAAPSIAGAMFPNLK